MRHVPAYAPIPPLCTWIRAKNPTIAFTLFVVTQPEANAAAFTATAVVDMTGTVTGWSEGAERLLGWTAAQAVGRPAAELLGGPPPALPDPGARTELRATVVLRRSEGPALETEVTAHPWLDASGSPRGYLLTAPSEELRLRERDRAIVERAMRKAPMVLGVYDARLRSWWGNEAAETAAGLDLGTVRGRRYEELFPEQENDDYLAALNEAITTKKPVHRLSFGRAPTETYDRAWAISVWPLKDEDGRVEAVANWVFDMSAEHWARQRLAVLSETSAAIGRTLDVRRTARELAEAAVPRFADRVTVDLVPGITRGDEPSPRLSRTVVLSRTVALPERDGETDREITYDAGTAVARCLASGTPSVRLTTTATPEPRFGFGPASASDPARWPPGQPVTDDGLREEGVRSRIIVPLRARGATLGVALFERTERPEPFTADDLTLAEELSAKAGIALDNARRFARERTTALTLQRSLLPERMPGQAAAEVASRYLPAGGGVGVGGDWFDVIPLSGTRVALVVGDVVGHGLHASASMGRLRTAVRTLADVDLPPDELLTHLDDLILHLSDDLSGEPAEAGATCLYAVYDPVARSCTLASAGHPLPLIIPPDGPADVVPGSPGPPLGIGGLPFEVSEFDVAEDSLLALYTDGLTRARERASGDGLDELRRVLSGRPRGGSLQDACDAVFDALRPDHGADDAALLLARTRALRPDHVASWDIPFDPAEVTRARQLAEEQLAAWGLPEASFVTELVVSELVTNALRHGLPPVRLRLIRDRNLITEVSDGSSTAPHLRRARLFDESGRGLLLVAQLTRGWGTRHTTTGKTIWCEQPLPDT